MSELKLTTENFNSEVIESDKPVLVDFYADWCGPCKMMGPVIEEIAKEYEGKIKVGKLNVDNDPEIAQQFNVMSIPTLIFFKDKQAVQRSTGFIPKEKVEEIINT